MSFRKMLAQAGFVFAAAFCAVGFAQGPPGMKMPPPQVDLAPAAVKTVAVAYQYVGLTEASKTVEVRARVQGFLETRDFQEGSFVKQDTRLFMIEQKPLQADLEVAKAQVEQAESRRQLADQELKRLKSVKVPGAVSAADIDQKEAESQAAAAAVRLAKAQLAKAELDLSYTTVFAPLTGFVGKAMKEIGSLVDNGQNSLLTIMQQVDPLYVSFKVSESDYLTWKRERAEGQLVLEADAKAPRVEITLLDGTPFGQTGVLDFENASVDTQTGTVELRATFKNKDHALKPGQFVKVWLKGWQRPNRLTVPQRAVGQSPQGAFVYVVGADSKAERRMIKTAEWAEKDWVVTDGLKEGEQVIVEGLTKVQPGMPVATGPQPGPGEGGPGAAPASAPAPASK